MFDYNYKPSPIGGYSPIENRMDAYTPSEMGNTDLNIAEEKFFGAMDGSSDGCKFGSVSCYGLQNEYYGTDIGSLPDSYYGWSLGGVADDVVDTVGDAASGAASGAKKAGGFLGDVGGGIKDAAGLTGKAFGKIGGAIKDIGGGAKDFIYGIKDTLDGMREMYGMSEDLGRYLMYGMAGIAGLILLYIIIKIVVPSRKKEDVE